jgi:hypothetical protein
LSLSGFTFQDDFFEFRSHLLQSARLIQFVHLGNKTFEVLSNPNAFYFVMSLFSCHHAAGSHISVIDVDGTAFKEKEAMLRRCILDPTAYPDRVFRPTQDTFLKIPGCPIAFRLPVWAESTYAAGRLVRNVADSRQGLATGDNDRFLRFRWEVHLGTRWHRYAKGGEFKRWFGNDEWAVDWEFDGVRVRNLRDPSGKLRSRPQNIAYFFRDGASWSSQTISAFGVRRLEPKSIFDVTGSSVFPKDGHIEIEQLLGLLNTPAFGELFAAIQGGVHYGEGYLANLPVPNNLGDERTKSSIRECISMQQRLHSLDPTSEQFQPYSRGATGLRAVAAELLLRQLLWQCELHNLELEIWDRYEAELGVPTDKHTRSQRFGHTTPTGLCPGELVEAMEKLRIQPTADASRATQSVVEEIAAALAIVPAKLISLISEKAFKEKLNRSMLLVPYVEHFVATTVLQLLGHQWPTEIEARCRALAWADQDGIIPLTDDPGEPTLFARVRERIAEAFGADRAGAVEREFEEIIGKPLGIWLASDFFKSHISQFRKRPIAWQLVSAVANGERRRGRVARNAPAFSCLVYYHRLNADLLPKLRTQYVGPFRMSLHTELGSLEKLQNRTADQDARRLELENKLEELKDFDIRLESIIVQGFSAASTDKILCKEPLDKWSSRDGRSRAPATRDELLAQERRYDPDLNDGVRVNIAPFQRAGLLAADVLAAKDIEKAIGDRAEWRADERRWCREGKLPRPGWWPGEDSAS